MKYSFITTIVRCLCILVIAAHAGWSFPIQNAAPPVDYAASRRAHVATAVRIHDDIAINGKLDEAAWKLAVPATDFTERYPTTGKRAVEPTEVRFLYDDNNLYVGVRCFDSMPKAIVSKELEEDFNIRSSDIFTLAFDSLHDERTAFLFSTNPAGAKYDAQSIDGSNNVDWDAVWDVKTTIDGEGWAAEFVIPFRTFRFLNEPTQVWGLNINRKNVRISEDADWTPLPIRYNISRASEYGTLEGLENIHQGRNIKVTPFVTAGVTEVRPANNLSAGFQTDKTYDGGMDLKYSLTQSLTFDGTFRTDFAQVEVDQQQVNLTRFSQFFPEKRDFFLENSGTFTFGVNGNLVPFFSRRIGLGTTGTPIPIIGGGRMSGKIGRYDVGFISMKTKRVANPGQTGYAPSNNFLVGRVKRNLRAGSWIGGLLTNRDSTTNGDYNRLYGSDTRLQFRQNRVVIDSFILRTDTPGKSGKNLARQFQAAWRDNDLTATASYNAIQPNFNPEAGYVRRGNSTQYMSDLTWNPRFHSSKRLRNLVFGTDSAYYENATTQSVDTRTNAANFGIRFTNNGTIDISTTETFDRLHSPFAIHSGIAIPAGDYHYIGYSASASSNPGRSFSGGGGADWGEFWNGNRTSWRGNFSWKPSIHFKVDTNYSRNDVKLPAGHFTTDLLGSRFLYAFNARAFLNAFVQYNTDTHQISSNIRFNIIHHPLSHLYIVYNDLRDTDSGQVLQRALIFKLTNLFNF